MAGFWNRGGDEPTGIDMRDLARLPNAKPTPFRDIETRQFKSAITDRLTRSMAGAETTTNQDLYTDLTTIRARSRKFFRDDAFGHSFKQLVRNNIVGPGGFRLSVQAKFDDGPIDRRDSTTLEDAFSKWSLPGACEVTGKHSFAELQHILISNVARDGEVFVRKVYGAKRGPHSFQLQVVPAHRVDEQLNREGRGGNYIRMGVEFDEFDKPVGYYVRTQTDERFGVTHTHNHEFVPASEMYHIFRSEDAAQWRGIPWAQAALRKAHFLDGLNDASLTNALAGAAKMGIIETPDGSVQPVGQNREKNGFSIDLEPGSFITMPPGYKLSTFDTKYPEAMYADFVKKAQQALASALGVSYNILCSDLEGVSYSSIRAGSIAERDGYKTVQSWFADTFLRPLFADWLSMAMAFDGRLRVLPQRQFDKFNSPVWQGKRWDWVDPNNEMNAAVQAVALGVKSRGQIIREQGGDPERVWAELEAEAPRLAGLLPAMIPSIPPPQETQAKPAPKPVRDK